MKIIYRKHFPPRPYKAITLLKWIIVREEAKGYFSHANFNHESIHYAQEKELLFIGFYMLYVLEFLLKLIYYLSWHQAYRNISFEKEAYSNQNNMNYLQHRTKFSWIKLII